MLNCVNPFYAIILWGVQTHLCLCSCFVHSLQRVNLFNRKRLCLYSAVAWLQSLLGPLPWQNFCDCPQFTQNKCWPKFFHGRIHPRPYRIFSRFLQLGISRVVRRKNNDYWYEWVSEWMEELMSDWFLCLTFVFHGVHLCMLFLFLSPFLIVIPLSLIISNPSQLFF
jgi:hypothetical protein